MPCRAPGPSATSDRSTPDRGEALAAAAAVLEVVLRAGADGAVVAAYFSRDAELARSVHTAETARLGVSRELRIRIYVDGRYADVQAPLIGPGALFPMLCQTVSITRRLAPDPYRLLPPAHPPPPPASQLDVYDPAEASFTLACRRQLAAAIEEGVQSGAHGGKVTSLSITVGDALSESARVSSNGFQAELVATRFSASVRLALTGPTGATLAGASGGATCFLSDLPDPVVLGEAAAARAMQSAGARDLPPQVGPVLVENRAAVRLVEALVEEPLAGANLHGGRSFLARVPAATVAADGLTIRDDPFVPRGLRSRLFDADGSVSPFLVIERGALKAAYLNRHQACRLQSTRTTTRPSNLQVDCGSRGLADLVRDVERGLLVTDGEEGGVFDARTGAFDWPVRGFEISGGQLARPFVGGRLLGNQADLWRSLAAAGNDPFFHSATRTPSLLFEGVCAVTSPTTRRAEASAPCIQPGRAEV